MYYNLKPTLQKINLSYRTEMKYSPSAEVLVPSKQNIATSFFAAGKCCWSQHIQLQLN